MDNIIDLCSSDEDVTTTTVASASLEAAADTIQRGIFQRQDAQIRSIIKQEVSQRKRNVKKKKTKNYGWSKKGSKTQRRNARMQRRRRKDSDAERPLEHAEDDVYAHAYLLPTATLANPNPRPILETLNQLAKRIVQNPDGDILGPSECKCPCCPYSTGCLGIQRYLLLQRCHQINKVLLDNPHLYNNP